MHSSLSDLYKHVDPEVLPSELGGTRGKMNAVECQVAIEKENKRLAVL
jgi:hypothetical protein